MFINRVKTSPQTSAMSAPAGRAGAALSAAVALLLLAGCVSVPDEIKGTSATPQQDLVRVMHAPQLYVGQEARFGGRVVGVSNEEGRTRLEIASLPLDGAARPLLGEPSRGRLYAWVNGFLDPVDFSERLVTVVGTISGSQPGKIGNTPYSFVVLQAQGYKRWRVVQRVVTPDPYGPWGWGGRYGPGWGPGWRFGGGWYGPAQIESIVTE